MQTEHDKALDVARINLLCRDDSVFLTTILFGLHFQWDESIPTACTNGRHLKVSPVFFMGLGKEERMFLLAHEAYHVAFMHMCRVGTKNFRIWNMAADYVINLMLVDAGFKFIKGGLLSEDYRGMCAEEVYPILFDKKEEDLPDCPDDMEQSEDDPEVESDIIDIVQQAAIKAKQSDQAGTIPGEVDIWMDKLLNPKLPWNVILANLLNGMAKEDYSYRRPNRRFMPKYYIPTLYSESIGEIAVAVDISGSCVDNFDQFISEIHSIHMDLKPDKTHVLSFDTRIANEYVIEQQADILGLEFKGGGGTLISPVYDWVKENEPKALIIFTDGYFHLQEDEMPTEVPLYWIIHDNPNFKPRIGQVIHFD